MKNILTAAALTISLMLLSCGNSDEKAIRDTAQGYLDAMGNYRIEEAEPYASQQTIDVTLHFFEQVVMPHVDSAAIHANMPATITLGDIQMEGDSAALVDYHKHTPKSEQDGQLHVVKENGKWVADVVIEIPQILNPSQQRREIPNPHDLKPAK